MQCHRSGLVGAPFEVTPTASGTKMLFWPSHPTRAAQMQQEQGPLLVAGGGGRDWNETSAAKSLNLGSGFFSFFGKQQSVKFTEFLTLVVQLPLCLYTSVLSGSSSERRPEAEEGGRI